MYTWKNLKTTERWSIGMVLVAIVSMCIILLGLYFTIEILRRVDIGTGSALSWTVLVNSFPIFGSLIYAALGRKGMMFATGMPPLTTGVPIAIR